MTVYFLQSTYAMIFSYKGASQLPSFITLKPVSTTFELSAKKYMVFKNDLRYW